MAVFVAFVAIGIPATAKAETLLANNFGAKGDGIAVDTAAIQKALDQGAGKHATISFKPGTYLIGSIFVKSGETLQIPSGVKLIGIQKLDAYPLMPTRVAGIEMTWPAALVNVYKQTDVKITGEGTIDGDGSYWWKSYWDLRKTYEPRGLRWASDYDARSSTRPTLS
jgi:polygalacturonase